MNMPKQLKCLRIKGGESNHFESHRLNGKHLAWGGPPPPEWLEGGQSVLLPTLLSGSFPDPRTPPLSGRDCLGFSEDFFPRVIKTQTLNVFSP